ncbi:MAG: 5-methyltetrahydropteroyltriglutamate--homocysteine S-methyltransferase [Rickettsiales bacterium]|jgi:5-methyltetrahydropteroyltriglutamate--homocysteine methyltransferase|nr:5-methyltetrahydropteroyltriglutamate--homocysteine S-methyltransferase [Rickettsiales bacterium]
MTLAANLGFPRIGTHRELKMALENFWKGVISESDLMSKAEELRARHWQLQKQSGIEHIPSNDFSYYDHVLDTIALVGAVPERYGFSGGDVDLTTYFAMARGRQSGNQDVVAMEMTKWFDTNYHYIVPEFFAGQKFTLSSSKILREFEEAKNKGILTRPVLLGPISFLLLGKMRDESSRWDLLPSLLAVYKDVLERLHAAGAEWVQLDEPCLVLDLDEDARQAYVSAYKTLSGTSSLKLLLATYFGELGDNLAMACSLPVNGLHIDLVRGATQLEAVAKALPFTSWLSLGVVDGRNIWKADLEAAELLIEKAASWRGGTTQLMVAPSCSLLHSPVDLVEEKKMSADLKSWMAFATQKLSEIRLLAEASNGHKDREAFSVNAKQIDSRRTSLRIHDANVKQRMASITQSMATRKSPFKTRIAKQQALLNLPLLPTTTIGSFPQTHDVRESRALFKRGDLSKDQYEMFLEQKTTEAMQWQDEIGIDVPVHGEFERNDMVEYFGEQLSGFAFTQNGWVQSYGSRCVKPPIIFGDVSRPSPMTVRWSQFAQSKTKKPVKGMLTGPVTILQWSFVRDDQPRSETCRQIALAIRDEVVDLEQAGIRIIQIDEPALREGLPLRQSDWQSYLDWAVESFRLCASGVEDATQIHTHMCYSEFNDIIDSIAALDADVISIETSRSAMDLLDAFATFKYPNEIGPGVYDIHSPRVPATREMEALLSKALEVLSPEQLWVNPDCGLKTRNWPEVKLALVAMVDAAKLLRIKLESEGKKRATA